MLNGFHIMTIKEYETYLNELKDKVREWKHDGLGYISVKCELVNELTKTAGDSGELIFTATQLKQIFDLAR